MRTSAAFHSGFTTISKNSRIFQDVSECSKLRISRICVAMGSLFLNSDSSSLCSSQASKEMGKQSDLREGNLGLPMRHIASTGCTLFDIVGSKLETLSLKLLSLPHRCGTPLLSVVFPSFQKRSLLQNKGSPWKATISSARMKDKCHHAPALATISGSLMKHWECFSEASLRFHGFLWSKT